VRFLAALSLTIALAAGTAAGQPDAVAENTPGEAVFVVSGRGFGHGVGMSQYGAFGQAKEGRTYDEILAHYYSGTELGRAGKKEVRVLLAEGRRAVTVLSTAPFRVADATGAVVKIPAGPLVLTPELLLPSTTIPAKGPLVLRAGKAPLTLDGRAYRGRFEIALQGAFLRVVNHVGVEDYIQGVVADEMPYTWPLEALKAQAVAARSYALKNLLKGKPFDLYSDVRSQVYGGIAAEKAASTQAVRATAGEVVTYGGQIASTYYFSTSGGRTASAADVLGVAVPYLVSRPDPWDRASPYHRWGPVLIGARTVQSKLGASSRVLDALGAPTPSGRIRSLNLQTLAGPMTVPASLVRTGLGLRSTWITVGVMRLDRPRGAVEFGSQLQLTGVARSITSALLSSSVDNGTWTPLGALERATDGSFSKMVQPTASTRYRIEGNGAAGNGRNQLPSLVQSQVLLVRVGPRLRLVRPAEPGVLTGTMRPRLLGALVRIERQRGSSWTQVAETSADQSGAFRVQLDLVPGTYRARVPASGGLAEAVSPQLTVEG
jgi:SpoIID/LytB domain protein